VLWWQALSWHIKREKKGTGNETAFRSAVSHSEIDAGGR